MKLCQEENLFIERTDSQRTDFGVNFFFTETTFLREKVDAKDLSLRNLVLQPKIDDQGVEVTEHMLEIMTD